MTHHIYQTKAFIIDSIDIGEANKLLTVFTEDLGLIYVVAQGVRIMKSKLRQSIQDASYVKLAVVRGREYWRLTSAEKIISIYDKRIFLEVRILMVKVLSFVKRLTAGESKHEELFMIVSKFFQFCFEQSKAISELSKNNQQYGVLKIVESVIIFRILESLGYGSNDISFDSIRDPLVWNIDFVEKMLSNPELCLKIDSHIQYAITSSHL